MKVLNYTLIIGFCIFSLLSISKADFVNIKNPLEGRYKFLGRAKNGKKFRFTVEFDLWKDMDIGVYQYKYRIYNNRDASHSRIRALLFYHSGSIISYGWDRGKYAPHCFGDNGRFAYFVWKCNKIPPNRITPWFWITSYLAPQIFPARGCAVSPCAKAYGKLPAPAPEPLSVILVMSAFFLIVISSKFGVFYS